MSDRPAPPVQLTAKPRLLSEIANEHDLTLAGPDRRITAFGALTTQSAYTRELLSYATSSPYLASFLSSSIAACVLHASLASEVPPSRSALLTGGDPADVFYTLFRDSVAEGHWMNLPAYRGAGTHIAPSARIHDNVVIGDDCVIMDNVVILPQSYVSDRVVVKPSATIGGEGFQLSSIEGRRRPVPHAGGVFIGDDVTVGSQTCVDRGLFGEFTTLETGAHIDNLVHVAHSVHIGRGTAVVACAEISGSVVVGDGAWLGPRCAINPGLRIGEHALIGTGSTVVEDVPPYALSYGVPARTRGWRCVCGKPLADAQPDCSNCGRQFDLSGDHPVLLGDDAD